MNRTILAYDKNPFLKIPRNKKMCNGFESISYLRPKAWEVLQQGIPECKSILEFKVKSKYWNSINFCCK